MANVSYLIFLKIWKLYSIRNMVRSFFRLQFLFNRLQLLKAKVYSFQKYWKKLIVLCFCQNTNTSNLLNFWFKLNPCDRPMRFYSNWTRLFWDTEELLQLANCEKTNGRCSWGPEERLLRLHSMQIFFENL